MIRIKQATLYPYRLRLKSAWQSSRGSLPLRQGCLIALQSDNGLFGWGDYAPLDPMQSHPFQRGFQELAEMALQLPGQSLDPLQQPISMDSLPAQSAVECALLDLEARTTGCSLAALLGHPLQRSIAVNMAGGALDETAQLRAQQAFAEGYSAIKFKVGLTYPQLEAKRLREIHHYCPQGLVLRLDANGAWVMAEARTFIEATQDLPIEMLEEPLSHPTTANLQQLQSLCSYPLALDESLLQQTPGSSTQQLAVHRLVLKPSLLGGPQTTLRWLAFAQEHGVEAVLTSALESAIGISMLLQLAALLPGRPCHGLATSQWLQDDVAIPPGIQGGYMSLPTGHGLGIIPIQEGLPHV